MDEHYSPSLKMLFLQKTNGKTFSVHCMTNKSAKFNQNVFRWYNSLNRIQKETSDRCLENKAFQVRTICCSVPSFRNGRLKRSFDQWFSWNSKCWYIITLTAKSVWLTYTRCYERKMLTCISWSRHYELCIQVKFTTTRLPLCVFASQN